MKHASPVAVTAPTPIYKVGLVLVRGLDTDQPRVCLTQVKAKNPDEQSAVDFGLPKGTRCYTDPVTGEARDARDAATAQRFRDHLEPLSTTLMREVREETGLDLAQAGATTWYDLGEQVFTSRKDGAQMPVQWYALAASEAMVAAMNPSPADAHAVRWCSLEEVLAMAENGSINPSYAELIVGAVQGMKDGTLVLANVQEWTGGATS